MNRVLNIEINPDLKVGGLDKALPLPPTELPPRRSVEEIMDEEGGCHQDIEVFSDAWFFSLGCI
jgi:hypothetical protein